MLVEIAHELVRGHARQARGDVAVDMAILLPEQEPVAVLDAGVWLELPEGTRVDVHVPQEGHVLGRYLQYPVRPMLRLVQEIVPDPAVGQARRQVPEGSL